MNAQALFREIRIIIEDELTQVYVFIEARGDAPFGVQGWHHKTFPPSRNVVDIITGFATSAGDPIMWPLSAPTRREADGDEIERGAGER